MALCIDMRMVSLLQWLGIRKRAEVPRPTSMFMALLSEAWVSLGANRVRTFLAMLGIIIGVGSVVLMQAIGAGSQRAVENAINALGNNLLIISPGGKVFRADFAHGQFARLDVRDIDALAQLPDVEAVTYSSYPRDVTCSRPSQIRRAGNRHSTGVPTGTQLGAGGWRWIGPEDMQKRQRVIILGAAVASKLFPGESALGRSVLVDSRLLAFRVVGVLQAKGAGLDGSDQDNVAFMPITALKAYLWPTPFLSEVQSVYVKAISADMLDAVTDGVQTTLRNTHYLRETDGDDFTIRNINAVMQLTTDTTQTFSLLLDAIASISLLVGSIGIMNIMLVTVAERTREIGIRKAVGATDGQILIQFLLEAVMVAVVGSVIGLLVGFGGGLAAEYWFSLKVAFGLWPVLMSLIMAVCMGISSGLYPAIKAAQCSRSTPCGRCINGCGPIVVISLPCLPIFRPTIKPQ